MQCSNCGHTNAEGASFCSKCGTALTLACPRCATPYEPGDAFCSNCGSKLRDEAATKDDILRYVPAELLEKLDTARRTRSMAGERRMVTMLFADIQGSTAAAERLDPEEWADIVNGAFERLIRPVYRFEGTLARLMGDGVLAFFGAPIAHEDDPERAIRSGLAMLQEIRPYALDVAKRWGVELDLRVGINTGLVVVGEVGSDLRVEYTALGDAVNVAARMEQVAEPGTLLISEATHRLVEPLFVFEELEPVIVKGKADPVAAFRVVAAHAERASMRGLTGTDIPLVGRGEELATLRAVADEVRRGRGWIATVIGEAGVGKSRLTAELRDALASDDCLAAWQEGAPPPGRLRWAEARCLSYNTAVAYGPFIDLFTRVFGIDGDAGDELNRERVTAGVDAASVDEPGRVITYLCVLLGIDPGGAESSAVSGLPTPALQRRVFAAVLDFLRGCAKASPVLLVFEDLHWADSVSLALLEELIQTTDRETLGVIGLMRPYRDDASWRFHETAQRSFAHRYTPIHLEPLDGDAATTLLRELVPDGLPADVESAVLDRAEGNPFFVEEMVRSLLESGGETKLGAIPGNISALLTARIDRLAAGSKLVVQLASVFGRQFEIGELLALVGDEDATETALSDLQSRDLVVERSRIPEREYEFRHALIQETAYSTILLKERRSLHAQIATYLESHRFDPQEMAHHLIESQQQTKAVPHLLAAAEQAARSMNLQTAIGLFDQVLTWVPTDDVETAIRAHEGLGTAYSLIPDLSKASSTYQAMLEVGRERSRPSVQVTALNRLGSTTAFLSGDVAKATAFLEEAKRLAEETGDEMGLAEYHMNSCMIATHQGDLDRAAQHDAETARIGTSAGSEQVRIGGLVQRAQSLVYGGNFEEGQEALVHAVRAAEGVTDPTVRVNLAATELILLLRDGDVTRAWTIGREISEMASSIGLSGASVMHLYAGMVASLLGNLEDALTHFAESGRLGEELGQPFLTAAAAASMSHLYSEIGIGGPDVETLREQAADLVAGPMGGMLSSMVHAELGWAALSTGDLDVATEQFETGVNGTSATKYLEAPALWVGLALARLASGAAEAAADLVAEAAEFVGGRSMAFLRPLVALGHGTVAMAGREPEKASRIFGDGADLAAGMDIAPFEWRLRAAQAGALRALGRLDEAETAADAAGSVIANMGSRFADPELADAFVASAHATLSELAGVSR